MAINLIQGKQIKVNLTGSFTGSFTGTLTGSLFGTASFASNSISSSYPLTVTGSTLRSTYEPGGIGASPLRGIFIGSASGENATGANNSNFFGQFTGRQATNANNSNFFGENAGDRATNANYSNFLGANAGGNATSARNSNFIGSGAGSSATNASSSNFIGNAAGQFASNASFSTILGYQAGFAFLVNPGTIIPGIGSNNIIIGTNITLANNRKDSINLGSIIFATGSYSDTTTNVFSGSLGTGRVGINNPNPNYTFDVSGSVNFTGNLYQNGTLFQPGGTEKYMWYSLTIAGYAVKLNSPALANPQQFLTTIDPLLPYTYVDIINQDTQTTYTSLTFTNITGLNAFISSSNIFHGKAIIYSNRNNTGNLRVGGVNLFSTQVSVKGKAGKVSSKRKYLIETTLLASNPGSTYNALTSSLLSTLVAGCSSIVPNFSTNYVNQTQVQTIVAGNPNVSGSYYSFAPVNKYKKRELSRYYVGTKKQGIQANGSIVNVSNPNQAKILGVAVYEYTNFSFQFNSFITNYGYSESTSDQIGPTTTGGSMLNVYIVQTSDNCRALVVEPIGVDRILTPPSFNKISNVYGTPILPNLTIYRKGNVTQVATYNNRIDNILGISTYLSPTLFSNSRVKTIKEVDVINLYSDRTCDLFEKAVKLDKLKYNNKKYVDLVLLNSNYQKN